MYTERSTTITKAASISTLQARATFPRRIGTRDTSQNRATVNGTHPHIPIRLMRSTSPKA